VATIVAISARGMVRPRIGGLAGRVTLFSKPTKA
jgi:hypothetical protein